jgi:hypothetical protein
VLYRRPVTLPIFRPGALWNGALRPQPVRIVVVRERGGRRPDEAMFCTA